MDIQKLMENQKIKMILAGFLALLLAFSLWLTLKPKDKTKKLANSEKELSAHTEEGIIKEEELDGLKFSNISLITEKGYTTFTCDVTNSSSEQINTENVNIELKDKNDNAVITLLGNIGSPINPGETRSITASAKGDFKNVVSKAIVHTN